MRCAGRSPSRAKHVTTIYTFGGPPKREIIKRAYGICGQSTAEFELEPEEYVKGLQAFNDLQGLLQGSAYNYPLADNEDGNPEDESGVPQSEVLGVSCYVASLIAQQIGKDLRLNASQKRAMSIVETKYQTVPTMGLRRTTPRGSGNRYWSGAFPYFFNGTSPS